MKNYQFITVTVLLVAIGAYLYLTNSKKSCSCGEHPEDAVIIEE